MTAGDNERQLRESMQHIADRAATTAVRETLEALGIDVNDPIKAQEQFAMLRRISNPRTQENLVWLESLHTNAERIADTSWRTSVRILVTAGLALLALVTKEYWFNHIWK